jgi:hypothetical protein
MMTEAIKEAHWRAMMAIHAWKDAVKNTGNPVASTLGELIELQFIIGSGEVRNELNGLKTQPHREADVDGCVLEGS